MSCEKKCCLDRRHRLIWRIAYTSFGVFAGLSIFVTFGFEYRDYHAAIWGLVSGVFAVLAMVVNILELRNVWFGNKWTKPLLGTGAIGLIGTLTGVVAFIVYVTIASYTGEGLIIYGNSNWMGAVWAFMTVKWAVLAAVYSWWYYKRIKAADGSNETTSIKYETVDA